MSQLYVRTMFLFYTVNIDGLTLAHVWTMLQNIVLTWSKNYVKNHVFLSAWKMHLMPLGNKIDYIHQHKTAFVLACKKLQQRFHCVEKYMGQLL